MIAGCWAATCLMAQVQWVEAMTPPKNALSAGKREGRRIYVCRGRLADGIHPGWFENGACLIPQKGTVEHATTFEFAVGRRTFWSPGLSGQPVIAGKQFNKVELLVCRRRTADGVQVGKAYLTGPHAGHCYVAVNGRELDFTAGFEILHTR